MFWFCIKYSWSNWPIKYKRRLIRHMTWIDIVEVGGSKFWEVLSYGTTTLRYGTVFIRLIEYCSRRVFICQELDMPRWRKVLHEFLLALFPHSSLSSPILSKVMDLRTDHVPSLRSIVFIAWGCCFSYRKYYLFIIYFQSYFFMLIF